MGVGPLVFFFILVALTIVTAIIFFPKRNSKRPLIKRIIGLTIILFIISPILLLALEDHLYFKSDAISDLKKLGIELKDDFEIIDNEVYGLTDYYRTTELKISNNDFNRALSNIKDSPNLKLITYDDFYAPLVRWTQVKDSIYNYKFKPRNLNELFIREMFEKKENYRATNYSIEINQETKTLIIKVNS
tara:strand:+ start:85337 stop:85903 length:567 start_codon:yes stop_codon:yes gene_type:complete